MKKKIIYISGADSFNPGEVRAAFEEVRSTLGLDTDTVLFGVPVDDLIAMEPVAATDSVETPVPEVTPEPVAKPKKTAKAKKEKPVEKIIEEPVAEKPATAPVVPILSVLGGEETAPVAETTVQEVVAETVTVETDEMPKDDAPDAPHEKTLEELLETMTPLREDVHPDEEPIVETPEPVAVDESLDDADATLASLATEFVDVQDKVPTFKKSPERGKISKLKNILPFKKKKHDDTGIMGDLFGWAGVAANDEDFSIPGFFTNVASKK